MWTCLNCNTENEDNTVQCIKCKLGKSYSEKKINSDLKQAKSYLLLCNIIVSIVALNFLFLGIILSFHAISINLILFILSLCIFIWGIVILWQYKKKGIYIGAIGLLAIIIIITSSGLKIDNSPIIISFPLILLASILDKLWILSLIGYFKYFKFLK